jgi:hypothetical protein
LTPVTFAVRSEASSATSVATSCGVLNRPVAIAAAALARIVSASTPVASANVAATPCSPSHRSVLTCP